MIIENHLSNGHMEPQERLLPLKDSQTGSRWPRRHSIICTALSIFGGSICFSVAADSPPCVPRLIGGFFSGGFFGRKGAGEVGDQTVSPCVVYLWIVRHGEKANSAKKLSACGHKRAERLIDIFQSKTPLRPSRLFATNPYVGAHIFREVQTLEPLAHALGLPIDVRFKSGDEAPFSAWLLRHLPKWCSTASLISWEHCHIPLLLQRLGCNNASESDDIPCRYCWPDEDYDSIVQLQYDVKADGSYNLHASSMTEGFPHICPDDNVVESQDQYECTIVGKEMGETLQSAFNCTWKNKWYFKQA